MSSLPRNAHGFGYVDPRRHWGDLTVHLHDRESRRILGADFNKFTTGRWGIPFLPFHVPADFQDIDCPRLGGAQRHPYRDYVRTGACHWLVNFNLRLATLALPSGAWRIVTSDDHSTVWDGNRTIFDLNYFALGLSAGECFRRARGRQLKLGSYLRTYLAPHHTAVPAPSWTPPVISSNPNIRGSGWGRPSTSRDQDAGDAATGHMRSPL
jgi:hypothetical protein